MPMLMWYAPSSNIFGRMRQHIACQLSHSMRRLLLSKGEIAGMQEREDTLALNEVWKAHWIAAGNGTITDTSAPFLCQYLDIPVGDTPLYRKLLFSTPAGVMPSDLTHLGPQLGLRMGRQWVIVEPFQEHLGEPHPVGVLVGHELDALDHGEPPLEVAELITRCAVLDALRKIDIGPALYVYGVRRQTGDGVKSLWKIRLALRDVAAVKRLVSESAAITEFLGVKVAHAFQDGVREGTAALIFGDMEVVRQERRLVNQWLERLSGNDDGLALLREG